MKNDLLNTILIVLIVFCGVGAASRLAHRFENIENQIIEVRTLGNGAWNLAKDNQEKSEKNLELNIIENNYLQRKVKNLRMQRIDLENRLSDLEDVPNCVGEYYTGEVWIKYTEQDVQGKEGTEIKIDNKWRKAGEILNYEDALIQPMREYWEIELKKDPVIDKLKTDVGKLTDIINNAVVRSMER